MRVKKVKIPRVIDLGCNNKAVAVVDTNGNALCVSYETPIAYAVREGGTRRTLYRLEFPYQLKTPTTFRHWAAFARWEGHPELANKKAYEALPCATAVCS